MKDSELDLGFGNGSNAICEAIIDDVKALLNKWEGAIHSVSADHKTEQINGEPTGCIESICDYRYGKFDIKIRKKELENLAKKVNETSNYLKLIGKTDFVIVIKSDANISEKIYKEIAYVIDENQSIIDDIKSEYDYNDLDINATIDIRIENKGKIVSEMVFTKEGVSGIVNHEK